MIHGNALVKKCGNPARQASYRFQYQWQYVLNDMAPVLAAEASREWKMAKQKDVETEIPCEIKAVSMNKPQKKKNKACMRENPFQSALPNNVRCWIRHSWWCKCYIWSFWDHKTTTRPEITLLYHNEWMQHQITIHQ